MRLYLDVPYSEKEKAKAMGVKWDSSVKKWYICTRRSKYVDYSEWIVKDSGDIFIATDYLYIVENDRICWKCGHSTRIVGLGICEFVHIYEDNYGTLQYETGYEYTQHDEKLRLAWVEKEEDIPPRLREYLKVNYSVRTSFSKTTNSMYFANHCDNCGALQGNNYIFEEPSSPLLPSESNKENIIKLRNLKVWGIPISDDIQIDWTISFSTADYAYFKYGDYINLSLSLNLNEERAISYKELYNLK